MKGKIIVIEGTDCSGKQTQTELLKERLEKEHYKVMICSFPKYETATGQIIGGPYLGKEHIGPCWFKEGAVNVDPKVASLYYAADRLYNINHIKEKLEEGYIVILDRYVYSNMAHQGGKITDKNKRTKMYEWLENLEFNLLELPKADLPIFLHVPYEISLKLKKDRQEKADQHESSQEHLINAENSYIEIAKRYNFTTINCVDKDNILPIKTINDEIYKIVKKYLSNE